MPTPPKKFAGPSSLNGGYHNFNWALVFDSDGNLSESFLAVLEALSATFADLLVTGSIRLKNTTDTGVASDVARLLISVNSGQAPLELRKYAGTSDLYLSRASGAFGSPTAVASGNVIGRILSFGYGATAFSDATASLEFRAVESFTDAAVGTAVVLSGTPIGSTTRETYFILYSTGLGLFNGNTAPSHRLDVAPSSSSVESKAIRNRSNTAGAGARGYKEVAGTSATGDAYDCYAIGTTGLSFAAGLDVSASAYKISTAAAANAVLGTGDIIAATSSGVTITPALTMTGGAVFAGGGTNLNHYEEGTFTITLSGMTAATTGTAKYTRIGSVAHLHIPSISGTSNATTCQLSGIPAAIRPATAQALWTAVRDNGTIYAGEVVMNTDGTADLAIENASSVPVSNGFTNSGSKGIVSVTISYILN